jgi:hypothetical protein
MSNPWGIKLKQTGLIQKLLTEDQVNSDNLEKRQSELNEIALNNILKMNKFKEKQSSLAVDAMAGKQGILH